MSVVVLTYVCCAIRLGSSCAIRLGSKMLFQAPFHDFGSGPIGKAFPCLSGPIGKGSSIVEAGISILEIPSYFLGYQKGLCQFSVHPVMLFTLN